MNKASEIITRFYTNHERPIDIAKALKVYPSYVTKIIQKDPGYINEKEWRDETSKEKRRAYQRDWAADRRKEKQELDDVVKKQHEQAVIELSVPNFK